MKSHPRPRMTGPSAAVPETGPVLPVDRVADSAGDEAQIPSDCGQVVKMHLGGEAVDGRSAVAMPQQYGVYARSAAGRRVRGGVADEPCRACSHPEIVKHGEEVARIWLVGRRGTGSSNCIECVLPAEIRKQCQSGFMRFVRAQPKAEPVGS